MKFLVGALAYTILVLFYLGLLKGSKHDDK